MQILDLYEGFFPRFPKKIAIYFSENGGGVEGRLNLSKNSSNLVAPPFPYRKLVDLTKCVDFFTYFFTSPLCVDEIKAEMLTSFSFLFPPSDGDQRRYMSVSE